MPCLFYRLVYNFFAETLIVYDFVLPMSQNLNAEFISNLARPLLQRRCLFIAVSNKFTYFSGNCFDTFTYTSNACSMNSSIGMHI